MRDATAFDIELIAGGLRPGEMLTFGGRSIDDFLRLSEMRSKVLCRDSGAPVAVFGVVEINKRVAHVWMVVSAVLARVHGKQIALTARRLLRKEVLEQRWGRVEAEVRADDPEALKLARLFFGEGEATLRQRTEDGCDTIMFSRID